MAQISIHRVRNFVHIFLCFIELFTYVWNYFYNLYSFCVIKFLFLFRFVFWFNFIKASENSCTKLFEKVSASFSSSKNFYYPRPVICSLQNISSLVRYKENVLMFCKTCRKFSHWFPEIFSWRSVWI